MNRQDYDFSVLLVGDDMETSTTLRLCGVRVSQCSRGDAVACTARMNPDVVFDLGPPASEGMELLTALGREFPRIPVVVVSDTEAPDMLRRAFLLGAFDYLVSPISPRMVADLGQRIQARWEELNGHVFSAARSDMARSLLFGPLPPAPLARGWIAATVDIVPRALSSAALDKVIDQRLLGSRALGIKEHGRESVVQLTLLFSDRQVERVERSALSAVQDLVRGLNQVGAWAAAGMGTVTALADLPGSLQAARLAASFALARGPGVFSFHAAQEVAGIPCPELVHSMDLFLSRLQSGDDWRDLLDPFFDALATCASARRLQQEVQRLFSCVADLVPISTLMERYYHIVDFVHGPEELRAELDGLCRLASLAVLTKGRPLADRKLEEFQEYVTRHYGDRLDLAFVCSALQISPSYLSKLIRRSLKTTFVDYLTEVRMARSRELLSGTDLLTSQIAEQVGYVYTHYFSVTFKKRFSLTPSEFRAQCRSRIPVSLAV